MSALLQDTIYAPITPVCKSGLLVVRLSGSKSSLILQQLLSSEHYESIIHRMAHVFSLYHPLTKQIIDQAVVIFFQAPHSFTGEDVIEFHLHGSKAVFSMLIGAICALNYPDVRMALAGEFSRRAFLNGKMDLAQAEGLADLIEAETVAQHQQAMSQMQGQLSTKYYFWRDRILHMLSFLEAYIDFPEEDISSDLIQKVRSINKELCADIGKHLDNRVGEIIKHGVKISIVGEPNIGKSSLLNHLAQRDLAIVSEIAGTTRDVIELKLDIGGYPVILYDTAGIRPHTDDIIEIEGMRRTKLKVDHSDIIILMCDVEKGDDILLGALELDSQDVRIIKTYNKADLYDNVSRETNDIYISVKENRDINRLLETIENKVKALCDGFEMHDSVLIAQERHRQHLNNSLNYLSSFDLEHDDLVISIEKLRLASEGIGHITGVITVEEVLDNVFANFCIGK